MQMVKKQHRAINRKKVKQDILDNLDNKIFWRMVDMINWKELIKSPDKIEIAEERLSKAIDKLSRKQKLQKIEGQEYKDINVVELRDYYDKILKLLADYFEPVWLDDSTGVWVSDDSYWDLRSSIIGYGKEFLLQSLEDDNIFLDMGRYSDYAENFGYMFHRFIKDGK